MRLVIEAGSRGLAMREGLGSDLDWGAWIDTTARTFAVTVTNIHDDPDPWAAAYYSYVESSQVAWAGRDAGAPLTWPGGAQLSGFSLAEAPLLGDFYAAATTTFSYGYLYVFDPSVSLATNDLRGSLGNYVYRAEGIAYLAALDAWREAALDTTATAWTYTSSSLPAVTITDAPATSLRDLSHITADGLAVLMRLLAGNDEIIGADGDDALLGGAGDDSIVAGGGRDLADGGQGRDTLLGGAGRDALFGGDGEDSLDGGEDEDLLIGGAGADRLLGGAGADLLIGGWPDRGDPAVAGVRPLDTLTGGSGEDVFVVNNDAHVTDMTGGETVLVTQAIREASNGVMILKTGTGFELLLLTGEIEIDTSGSVPRRVMRIDSAVTVTIDAPEGQVGLARLPDSLLLDPYPWAAGLGTLGVELPQDAVAYAQYQLSWTPGETILTRAAADARVEEVADGLRLFEAFDQIKAALLLGSIDGHLDLYGPQVVRNIVARLEVALEAFDPAAALRFTTASNATFAALAEKIVGQIPAFRMAFFIKDLATIVTSYVEGDYRDQHIRLLSDFSAAVLGLVGRDMAALAVGFGGIVVDALVDTILDGVAREISASVTGALDHIGTAGNDVIDRREEGWGGVFVGGDGDDTLFDGAGDATFVGGSGNGDDRYDGGGGWDSVTYTSALHGVAVDLGLGRATGADIGSDTLVGIEAVTSGDGADRLLGSEAANALSAGAGADWLEGRGGNDSLFGGEGDDTLLGGAGSDLIDGGAGTDRVEMAGLGRRGVQITLGEGALHLVHGAETDRVQNVERLDFADGTLWTGADSTAAQVLRLYQAALERAPDQSGLNYWIGALGAEVRLEALASDFLGSAEFAARFGAGLGEADFVAQLYRNVLGREGDHGGLQYWTSSLLYDGVSRASVLVAFSESDENRAATADVVSAGIWDLDENAAAVARLYDTALGRLPDVGGLGYWKTNIEAGTQTLTDLATVFTNSPEFQAVYGALGNRAFVELIYQNALHRAGEAGGVAYWTGLLDSGLSRAAMVVPFSESAEHAELTAANINNPDPTHFGILFA
ncbi:hemolysin type calcium-binding protein [Humitalea rosea]|uniref:Hemolysin type calcium-binding protein n=1 Tax=Humitalea rosea TaxID=990373 RepID=A0A2W7J3W4_9PROT|nr:DUF4214 domain-containing protein [Humitalea rosea]PZW45705.1 hemolysin type calcium-binding protein [Humitalea rosea]